MLTRASLAKVLYDIAQTYETGSKESKDFLSQAAAKYDENYWKYRRWAGCYTFRIEEARCYKELGEYDKALEYLGEMALAKPSDEEGIRRIRTVATELAMQIALLPQVKKPKDAWDAFENWEKNIRQADDSDGAEPVLKYLGGEAALEFARGLDRTSPTKPGSAANI